MTTKLMNKTSNSFLSDRRLTSKSSAPPVLDEMLLLQTALTPLMTILSSSFDLGRKYGVHNSIPILTVVKSVVSGHRMKGRNVPYIIITVAGFGQLFEILPWLPPQGSFQQIRLLVDCERRDHLKCRKFQSGDKAKWVRVFLEDWQYFGMGNGDEPPPPQEIEIQDEPQEEDSSSDESLNSVGGSRGRMLPSFASTWWGGTTWPGRRKAHH